MEAEYVAASEAAKEAVWFRNFLLDLDVVPNLPRSLTVYCDNTGAVANSKEPRDHKVAKHIERKYHLIRGIIKRGDIVVAHISSEENRADPFTKSFPTKPLSDTRSVNHVDFCKILEEHGGIDPVGLDSTNPCYEIDKSKVDMNEAVLIGEGAYGEVYVVKWRGTEVAAKTFRSSIASNQMVR
ncbi:hypothetical protein AgCh_012882 [Apium graveolens]